MCLGQGDRGLRSSGAHIGQLLFLGDVDVNILITVIGANDHALISLGARLDEEVAAVSQLRQRVLGDLAGAVSHQGTGRAGLDIAGPDIQAVRDGVSDTGTAGLGHELGAEADEATGRNAEDHAYPVALAHIHGLHLALAGGQQLGDSTLVLGRGVNGEDLVWLVGLAVDFLGHNLRLANRQLEAFAAHGLNKHGQRHLATALDLPSVGALGGQHAQGNVTDELLLQAGLDHTRGELIAAALACHRGGVHADGHGDGRLVYGDARQSLRVLRIGDGVTNHDVRNAGDSHDVTGDGFLGRLTLEADGAQQLGDLHGLGVLVAILVVVDPGHLLALLNAAGVDTQQRDTA